MNKTVTPDSTDTSIQDKETSGNVSIKEKRPDVANNRGNTSDYEDETENTPMDFNNSEEGFRHTSSERNNIRRGRPRHEKNGLQVAEDAKRKPVTGTGLQERHIQASREARKMNTHLIYVGNLSKQTTEKALREHLTEIEILQQCVADVIKLNCRKPEASSFCISLFPDKEEVEEKVYNPSNWPRGVYICRFQEKSTVTMKKGSNNHPPRFRQVNRKYSTSNHQDWHQRKNTSYSTGHKLRRYQDDPRRYDAPFPHESYDSYRWKD